MGGWKPQKLMVTLSKAYPALLYLEDIVSEQKASKFEML